MSKESDPQGTFAPAASCAGEVLRLLRQSPDPLSLSEMERRSRHTKSLISRVLRELELQDFVVRERGGRYRLGLEAFELGPAYMAQLPFEDSLREILKELSDETGETVNLGFLRGREVLYAIKYVQPTAFVTISRVGGRVPAHCVAIGKALLADLDESEVRRRYADVVELPRMTARSVATIEELAAELEVCRGRGYAVDRGEGAEGRCGMAMTVSILSESDTWAGVSVSTSTERFEQDEEHLVGVLQVAQQKIAREVAARRQMERMGALTS